MPQKVLKFTGINRKVNEFQGAGACEELINIRPSATGLEVIKPKKEVFKNVDYDVYNHSFGDNSFFIGVRPENTYEVYLVNNDGGKVLIDDFAAYGPEYSIAFVGNQILLSHNTSLHVYAYKDGAYRKMDAYVPDDLDISYSVSMGYGYSEHGSPENANPEDTVFKSSVMEHWSSALGRNYRKNEIFGPVLVAFNYTMSDGSEFWTNKWLYVNPFLYLPQGDNGKKIVYYRNGETETFAFNSFGVTFTIRQKYMSEVGINNMVKSINVYASRPIFPYNIDTMQPSNLIHDREITATAMGMTESGISKELLYFQKSIPVSEIEAGDVTFSLDFSESQAGERVLEVDNGPVKRAGKIVSYNNRAHIYDSYATLKPQSIVCSSNAGYMFSDRVAYVHLDCNNTTVVCKTTAKVPAPLAGNGEVYKIYCCYPDARATKILVATNDEGTSFCTVNLKQSERYNFAFGEASYERSYSTSDTETTTNVVHEANSINVSAQYNPFVFPVEYSYSLGGKIIDIATSYLPISSTQVGQYPLTVFTSSGIFALEQGGGSSLYSNIVPLQPLVINGKAAATPYGTFFISSKSIYLLSGREVANVSYQLDGDRELELRETDAYRKLCCDKRGFFFNFESLLSSENFEDFVTDAVLTYDQLHNELFISSSDDTVPYSYVFNLDTKSYHKVAKRYVGTQAGARYATEDYGGTLNVVDLHLEKRVDQSILLQSRPLSLEAFYTHIQRLILLADANLTGYNQNLCLSVFASDNLNDWKCIISSQKHNTVLRQIRTNRAAKAYKDYIILINGTVDSHTDLSDLMADYTIVQRRLG